VSSYRRRDWPARVITQRTGSTNGALCLRRRRLGSRYAAEWLREMRGRSDPSSNPKQAWRDGGAERDCRPARCHRNAARNRRCLAGLRLITLLRRQFVGGTVVVRHSCRSRFGAGLPMIDTRCVDCPYREVEGTKGGQDSCKGAQGWSDSIGRFSNGGRSDTVLTSQVPVRGPCCNER